MKIKASRKVIGTFSEIENLIRSLPQLFYDHLEDTNDEYWLWFLEIHKYVKFVNMPKVSESQLVEMDSTLERLMNMRLQLTCVQINPRKYDPPVTFKEHYLSHISEDIRNLAPTPFLKTDLFESKVSKETV